MLERYSRYFNITRDYFGARDFLRSPLDELVDVGTRKFHIRCVGAGRPTIMIDAGFGETIETWELQLRRLVVRPELAHMTGKV